MALLLGKLSDSLTRTLFKHFLYGVLLVNRMCGGSRFGDRCHRFSDHLLRCKFRAKPIIRPARIRYFFSAGADCAPWGVRCGLAAAGSP